MLFVGIAESNGLQYVMMANHGGEKHCGKCGTCIERREALAEAVIDDPTEYQD